MSIFHPLTSVSGNDVNFCARSCCASSCRARENSVSARRVNVSNRDVFSVSGMHSSAARREIQLRPGEKYKSAQLVSHWYIICRALYGNQGRWILHRFLPSMLLKNHWEGQKHWNIPRSPLRLTRLILPVRWQSSSRRMIAKHHGIARITRRIFQPPPNRHQTR